MNDLMGLGSRQNVIDYFYLLPSTKFGRFFFKSIQLRYSFATATAEDRNIVKPLKFENGLTIALNDNTIAK